MASPFDEIDRLAQVAISAEIGEAIILVAMTGGEYSSGIDPEKEFHETFATVSLSPRTGDMRGSVKGSEMQGSTTFATMASELWIDHATAAALPWQPKRNDVAILLDRGGARYTITAVFPMEGGELQILIAAGAAPFELTP